ncbi:hypothetical protein LWI28_028147 [Acer negundo]|uniref:Uncharacterized protein n=1 Tax=Acer negundo TaxID=4023 RepID=A0AAD5J286_ACENE|nr:hypothetical protein LWI28_028147 [Acer negundo]
MTENFPIAGKKFDPTAAAKSIVVNLRTLQELDKNLIVNSSGNSGIRNSSRNGNGNLGKGISGNGFSGSGNHGSGISGRNGSGKSGNGLVGSGYGIGKNSDSGNVISRCHDDVGKGIGMGKTDQMKSGVNCKKSDVVKSFNAVSEDLDSATILKHLLNEVTNFETLISDKNGTNAWLIPNNTSKNIVIMDSFESIASKLEEAMALILICK